MRAGQDPGLITKALEKDRALRCQSASELRADLQCLKRDRESGRKAVDSSDPLILDFQVSPSSDSLRSQPRYLALLRKVDLEP